MRPANLTVVGIYTIATAGLLWVPLLNVLHAEASMVIAVLAFFLSGLDAISLFDQDERERPRVRTVVLRHSLYLVVPFIIYQLARLWLPGCGFWVGVKFYLLFPVISVILAVALAFLLTGLPLRRTRTWFITVAFLLILLPVLYDLGLHPQFYVYNHVFGGVLGPIYDLELASRAGLWWFRFITLLWAGFAVLVGYALREPVRGGVLGITLIAVLLVFLYANPGRFGFNTTYRLLADELGSEWRTPHFVIHYDSSSVSETEIGHLAADHEFRYFQLARRLGFESDAPIHSYLYPDAETRARLTGAGYTNIAPVWLSRPQVHVLLETYDQSFTHELAHVFSREFGLPVINASLHVGLVEGFAVAMEPPDGFPPPDDQVAAIVNSPSRSGVYGKGSVAEAVAGALSPSGFWTGRGAVSYTTMGSFVDYLITRFGIDKFGQVYRMESFPTVYGESAASLADDWEGTLVGRDVVSGVYDMAAARFAIPSLFERHCPHDMPSAYRIFRLGINRLAAGDTAGALVRFERSMRSGPPMTEVLDIWAKLKLAQGDFKDVAPRLGSVWQNDEPFPPVLGLRLGDAHALSGNAVAAEDAYRGALEGVSAFYRETRAILRLRIDVADRPDIVAQLVSPDEPDERADRLLSINDTTGTANVLAGLLFAQSDEYASAVNALKSAAGSLAEWTAGERYWAWLAAFAFRAGQYDSSERFRLFAVEAALATGDKYQVARLEDFGERISWAENLRTDRQ